MSGNPSDSPGRQIGIYGGAFDPVHHGHLRTALEVSQTLGLDELRFVPSGNPPHRSGARADAAHRVEMLKRAVRDTPGVVIDQREVQNTRVSYSFDTLEAVAGDYPDSRLTLVIGMDQFSVFDTWYRWQDLLQRYRLAVMERPGQAISEVAKNILKSVNVEGQDQQIQLVSVTQLQISSSRIRDDLARQRNIQFLVPQVVREYIHSHGLYTGASATRAD